ncbi:MAG: helix-turn-helix domain-containing protein, partial [Chloroflexi bacterium]|nr:helix-turn-helix domain-containing protein [Chloroflexota bacterium]
MPGKGDERAREETASVAALLRGYRREAGLTQEELAERAGLSVRAIGNLERGEKHVPRKETVLLLADALGLPPGERERLMAAVQRARKTLVEEAAGQTGRAVEPAAEIRTFLIADIRGYTAFTQERGDEAAAQLATTFAAIMRERVAGHGGEVIELRGDEELAVFGSPRHALRAAMGLAGRFAREGSGDASPAIKVGMGLDAGEAVRVEGGYRGRALNLAARLCSLAGPGEVLASEEVVHLAGTMEGVVYRDRGEARLKGLADPVRVIQITPEGVLPTGLSGSAHAGWQATTLPAQTTPFIGREEEVEAICGLLRQEGVRLLTLTGPGGIGKTRLALEAARLLLPSFPDGVHFVSLAPLRDPGLVAAALAAALGVTDAGGRPLLHALAERLRERHTLLVLDNFEHVLDACSLVSDLLDFSPSLKVLSTSRTPLHLRAERGFPVPPMKLPTGGRGLEAGAASQCEAVRLFVERACAVKPAFALTEENASMVAELCARLDGLPLAIELAAARVRLLSPQALLGRLSDRLQLLAGGARDVPARQQTILAAIDWSYDLLDEGEQRLFARLSVFAGGCTLEAVEAVCGPAGEVGVGMLEGLASLVDESLVYQLDGGTVARFTMLETIRQYAADRLRRSGEADSIHRRHARHYLSLAEGMEPELRGPAQQARLEQLESEHDNLRVALRWTLQKQEAEMALRLCAALRLFWDMRGYFVEGCGWLEEALALPGDVDPAIRASALRAAGALQWRRGATGQAEAMLERGLALSRGLDDRVGVADALSCLGALAVAEGEVERADSLLEESLTLQRACGDTWGAAISLNHLGLAAMFRGDYGGAVMRHRESLALRAELKDRRGIADSRFNVSGVALWQGDYDLAGRLLGASVPVYRDLKDPLRLAECMQALAIV